MLPSVWGVPERNYPNIHCQVCVVKNKYIHLTYLFLKDLACHAALFSSYYVIRFLNVTDLLGGVYEVW